MFLRCAHYGVAPYISLSRLCAKARAGGMSILLPMISIYAPVLLARAAFIASSRLAKRSHSRGIPMVASERLWQIGIVPRREVIVGPIRVLFQRAFDQVAAIVEYEYDDVCSEPSHGTDVVRS